MLKLLDITWQLYLDDRDVIMPDPDKAVLYKWSAMRNGISLHIKQEEFFFVQEITDQKDIKTLKSHWDEISGKSLRVASSILAGLSPKPDVEALVACGKRLAVLLSVPPAPDKKLRSKIEEILFDRGNFDSFQQGLLTLEELRNLILSHLQTLLCQGGSVEEPREAWNDRDLCREVEIALRK